MKAKKSNITSLNIKDEILWKKNMFLNTLLISLICSGTILYFLITTMLIRPYTLFRIIITIIALVIIYFIFVVDICRHIPSFVGVSKKGIYFKYGKREDYIPWVDVKEIRRMNYYIGKRWRIEKRWELLLKDGKIKHINLINKNIIKKVYDQFEKYKSCEKTE